MRRDPTRAILVLDAMLEFFDGGRRWTRGELVARDGQARCLVGALRRVRNELRIRGDGTVHYLRDAIKPNSDDLVIPGICFSQLPLLSWNKREPGDADLMGFNDGSTYDEVHELIVAARAIAQAELAATAPPERIAA
jgi:hypothetical protein